MPASKKTQFIAEQSILKFCATHRDVFYWTFTFADNVTEKLEAEKRFKAFRDLIKRRGGEELHFWEPQRRGSWHVHLLTDKYLNVVWLRQWMIDRGWGPQMRVERVASSAHYVEGKGWLSDNRAIKRLVWYLRKYLTKSLDDISDKKKPFGGSAVAKIGTTMFKWMITVSPYSYLYYYGSQSLHEVFGEWPSWLNIGLCIRLGYELTNYGDYDPFFVPP